MTDDIFGKSYDAPERGYMGGFSESEDASSSVSEKKASYGSGFSQPSKSDSNNETGFADDEIYISRPPKRLPPANVNFSNNQNRPNGGNYSGNGGGYSVSENKKGYPPKKTPPKKKKKRKKKHRKWPYILLILLLLAVGGFFYVWNTSFFQNTTDSGSAGLNPEIAGSEKETVNILVLGIDNDEGRRENMLTDTIMIVSVDCENERANVLQIPRDTYIGTQYTATGKINALYSSDSEYGGIEGLSDFIYENLGIPLDHYATITMEGLRNVIDEIGGVTVDVPYAVNLDGVKLKPGEQTLDGNESEKLLRQRHGEGYESGDLDRLEVQRIFMASLVEQFLGTSKSTLLSLLPKLSGEITTDMTTGTMVDLLSKVSGMSADSIGFYMLPGQSDYVTTKAYGNQSVYGIHKQQSVDLINSYFLAGRDPITAEDILLPELSVDETAFDDVGGNVNEILGNETESSTSDSASQMSSSSQTTTSSGSSGKSS